MDVNRLFKRKGTLKLSLVFIARYKKYKLWLNNNSENTDINDNHNIMTDNKTSDTYKKKENYEKKT